MIKKINFNFPFTIIIIANLFTVFAFLIAPFDYSKGNPLLVVLYVFFNLFFVYLGYIMGVKKGLNKYYIVNKFFIDYNKTQSLFIFCFYAFTFLIKYAYLLRFSIFDVAGMFNYLVIGIVDPQLGYQMSIYDTRPHTVSWLVYTLISIINQVFFIYAFIVWKQLGKLYKSMFIIFLMIEVFYWFGRGTGFGIVAIISNLLAVFVMNFKVRKINFRLIFTLFFLFLISISVFGFLKNKRAGGKIDNLQVFNTVGSSVDENHLVFKLMPDFFLQTYMHSTVYLTQGYFHLGIALSSDIPFTSTFMFGSNPATLNIANIFDVDLWDRTYMKKLNDSVGIDDVGKWHTAYLWYANDVSFLGVPLVLFLLSYFLSISYIFVLKFDDLLSKIYFVILFNSLIYLFANNTYLYQLFYSFVFISIIWFVSRVYNVRFK